MSSVMITHSDGNLSGGGPSLSDSMVIKSEWIDLPCGLLMLTLGQSVLMATWVKEHMPVRSME